MNVLYDSDGKVDFENPIHITVGQKEKLISFFNDVMGEKVILEEVTEIGPPGGGGEAKKWEIKELCILLSNNQKLITEKLIVEGGRSEQSVLMRQGSFVPNFFIWLRKKGYSAPTGNKLVGENLVKEYLKELKDDN